MLPLEKVIVPLITAFTDDTTMLSEVRFARTVAFHRDHGAAGFLVASEAGEVNSLSHAERKQLVEWAVREAKGLPVFVNVSAQTTAAVIDLAQHADRHGVAAGVLVPPTTVPLFPEERHAFLQSVQRFGNLRCTILTDPESGSATPLQTSELAKLMITGEANPEEFVCPEGVVTPYAVAGSETTKILAGKPKEVLQLAQALFRKYRSHRLGKAWLVGAGVDVGHTRAPVRDLDQQGTALLDGLKKLL